MEPPNHLIIVCGHAMWAGGPTNGLDESEWIIESWKKGETPTYTEHIKAGLRALREDERSVLIFSGGPTVASTPLSEARSYYNLAIARSYWGILPLTSSSSLPTAHHPRIHMEERALDSYQNILFSILHFWRTSSNNIWPTRLTLISHAFKRRRLIEAHTCSPSSLAFPRDNVTFIGINPPDVPLVLASEERAVEEWLADPQGWESEGLRKKREGRNPWGVKQVMFLDEEERRRSGIMTKVVEGGLGEVLDVEGGGRWPWIV